MSRFGLLIATCLTPLLIQPAFADTAPPAPTAPAADAATDDGKVPDIIVTSQRRKEKLQSIPLVVSAFNDKMIDQLHLSDALQTSKFVPGLISSHNAGLSSANAYYIRGLGNSQSTATFDAPVTTYVDDVYIARQNANNYAFFDTERVEILRGPQGTLFGRNTTGGAVSVVMRKPSDHAGASVEVTGGSYDRFTTKVIADLPISDTLLTKTSGFYIHDRGYLKDITTNDWMNGEQDYGIREDVRWLATDRLTVDLSGEFTSNKGTYQGLRTVPSSKLNPYLVAPTYTSEVWNQTAAGLPTGDCTNNNVNTLLSTGAGQCSLSDDIAFSANVNLQVGDHGNLTSITGYRRLSQGYIAQYDANNTNKYNGYIIADNGHFSEFQQELKYNGNALDDRLHFVTGVFFFHEWDNDRQTTFDGGTTSFKTIEDQHLLPTTTTAAIYGQADYDLTSKFVMTVGGRFTYERKNVAYEASQQFPGFGYTSAQVAAYGIPLEQTQKRFTPRVAVSYKVQPDVMLFASATNGFKSGGWNGGTAAAQNAVIFNPERTWSFEGGVKSEWLDHRIRLNLTGYFASTQDLQVTAGVISPVTGAITSLPFNAGTLQVYGIEGETNFQVTPELSLFANPSFMHAHYTYIVPSTTAISTAFTPVRTPTFQYSGGVNYMHPVDRLDGSVGGSMAYRHNSSYFVAVLDTTRTRPEKFLDGSINYKSANKKVELSFEVSNLTNQKTVTANFLSLFPGDPRRFTVRLKLKI